MGFIYLFTFILLLHKVIDATFVVYKNDNKSQEKQDIIKSMEEQKCQPLTIPVCSKFGYNVTKITRDLFLTQPNVYTLVQKYIEILDKLSCSQDLLFLLCTTFNPLCFKNFQPTVKPCKTVCRKVKSECQQTLMKFQIEWPAVLNCDSLPEYDTDVCITPNSLVPRNCE